MYPNTWVILKPNCKKKILKSFLPQLIKGQHFEICKHMQLLKMTTKYEGNKG
jgi:hypothetical protein